MKHVLKSLALGGAALALLAVAGPARAQNITITASVPESCQFTVVNNTIAFGVYNSVTPNDVTPLTATADLNSRCTRGSTFTVTISDGGARDATSRQMENQGTPGNFLRYDLFLDAGYVNVWGNTAADDLDFTSPSRALQTHTIHARVPEGQDPLVGAYQDVVTVTFTP
ncbi:MAG TPA: spore coat U domain-containing protein [Anaeromyxobacteraceae bacterium]|nr:spore coat U domain-containing protein [Anaeromyxobacteraceae bacterium]